ncbi:unnamed protein product [Discosporangium mesarthrocarpum]
MASQNGSGALMGMTRCMLSDSALPKTLWADVFKTAVSLSDRLPPSALRGKSPYSVWHQGKTPSLHHLQAIDLRSFVHDEVGHGELETKAWEGRLVGHGEDSRTYRIWRPVTHIIIPTRNVTFIEATPSSSATSSSVQHPTPSGTTSNVDLLASLFNGIPDRVEGGSSSISSTSAPPVSETQPNEQSSSSSSLPSSPSTPPSSTSSTSRPFINAQQERELAQLSDYNVPPQLHLTISMGKFAIAYPCSVENLPPGGEISSYRQAIESPDADKWQAAMVDRHSSLMEHQSWGLVPPPPASKIVISKWIYKVRSNGRYTAPFVAQGFSQDLEWTSSALFPVARITSIRIILAFAKHHTWNLIHLGVKTAFIQSDVEEIYIKQPHQDRLYWYTLHLQASEKFVQAQAVANN